MRNEFVSIKCLRQVAHAHQKLSRARNNANSTKPKVLCQRIVNATLRTVKRRMGGIQ
jgi:hypothetical protein